MEKGKPLTQLRKGEFDGGEVCETKKKMYIKNKINGGR